MEELFEFTWVVESLVRNGWTFGEINYGEERLGIAPSITLSKGDFTKKCYSDSDISALLDIKETYEGICSDFCC